MTRIKAVGAAVTWAFSGVIGGILVAELYKDSEPPRSSRPHVSQAAPTSTAARPSPRQPRTPIAATPTPKPPAKKHPAPAPPVGKALRRAVLKTSELAFVGVGTEDKEPGRVPGLENTNPAAMTVCAGERVASTNVADDSYQAWDMSLWGDEAVGNEVTSFYDNGAARVLAKVRLAARRCTSPSFRLRASPKPEWADDLIHIVRDSPEPDDQYHPPEDWVLVRRGQVLVQLVLRKAQGRHSEYALRLALNSASRL